jgi:hypothetical protein
MNTPLSTPTDLIVHIGTGKAGSSSIQAYLHENRERLGELGLLYPKTPGAPRHARVGLFLKSDAQLERSPAWYKQKLSDPTRFRRRFRRRLFSEIEGSGLSRVLLSDEILFHLDARAVRRMRRLTDQMAKSLRLVVYLRRQDDHLVSRYQQGVKTGMVLRLSEWAQRDMSYLYDYHANLRTWHRLLAPDAIVVRRFEAGSFVDGSLYQDFLDAAEIDARAEDLQQITKRNESLDAESVEFLRLFNLYRVENEGANAGLIDNWSEFTRLAEASSGPVLTLPDPLLDRFMERWEGANQAVARRWLGDATGELFHVPRRTHKTTTVQRFDPARVDHFLELLDLPERMGTPLRTLAEREAKAPPG